MLLSDFSPLNAIIALHTPWYFIYLEALVICQNNGIIIAQATDSSK